MFSFLAQADVSSFDLNSAMFIGLPYVALVVFFFATIRRYVRSGYSYSSYSTQFLENKKLFFASTPWHWGIIFLAVGHLVGFLVPSGVLWWNGVPARLYIIEFSALVAAILALTGLVMGLVRRTTSPRIAAVTSRMDYLILTMLLIQIMSGMWIAIFERWGTSWFAGALSPYLWSLFKFNPKIDAVSAMPFAIKLHVVGAFLIFMVFPFTRLVHLLVAPLHYMFRLPQRVIWNSKPEAFKR
ncbi:MAG: respiratory nitrate reductase subunit gamma [Planctomycetes bacterium]|nr:respiratory nitrate reductase subunit gamma [Planctomycetota bacterium]